MFQSSSFAGFAAILLALWTVAFSEENTIRTRSGVSIPLSVFNDYTTFLSRDQLTDRLCELDGFTLLTASETIDLDKHTSDPVLISSKGAVIMANGKRLPYSSEYDTYLRRGPKYTTATNGAGKVVGVWGPELVLLPVHGSNFPNVYINTYRLKGQIRLEESHPFGDDSLPNPFPNPATIPVVGLETSQGNGTSRISLPGLSRQSSCSSSGSCRTVRVACVSDSFFCSVMGSRAAAISRLTSRLALASEPYERQTCIKLVPTYFEIPCPGESDPYADYTSNPRLIISSFRSYWVLNRDSVVRDVAHYFPGRYVNDGLSGVAYLDATCSKLFGYGWSEDQEPIVIAHEIGHNLACEHSSSGLMKPSWRRGDPLIFSAESVNTIVNFVDTIGSSTCIPQCSGSSPPSPTSTPSAQPSPDSEVTCTEGFSRQNVFDCSKKIFGTIFARGYSELKLNVIHQQLKNSNVFTWKSTNRRTLITELSYKVTMSEVSPTFYLDPRKVLTKPKRKITSKVSNDDIVRAAGMSTCCGNMVYLHMNIRFCYYGPESVCAAGTIFLSKTMDCTECTLRRFIPQTSRRKCPLCRA